jgi:hypothetical protein
MGASTSGFVFEHGDGQPYGLNKVDSVAADRFAEVFTALCALALQEREARVHVDAGRSHVGASLSREELLREVLRRIPVHTGASMVREERMEYMRTIHA